MSTLFRWAAQKRRPNGRVARLLIGAAALSDQPSALCFAVGALTLSLTLLLLIVVDICDSAPEPRRATL